MPTALFSRVTITAVFSLFALAACSAGTADKKSGGLTVSFPSTAAAIASDTLELHVLDGSDPNACLAAIQARQKNQPLAKPLLSINAQSTCNFLANAGAPFDVGYGVRAFLVVAQRAPTAGGTLADFMIGCALAGVGDVSNQVDVSLTVVDDLASVPAFTKCSTLSDRCKLSSSAACY